MGVDIIRLASHSFSQASNTFFEQALVLEHQTEIVACFKIIFVKRQRLTVAGFRRAVTAKCAQCVAEIGMAAGIIRFDRDGAPVARDGGVKGTLGA